MELVQLGSISRGFTELIKDEKFSQLDDKSKEEAKQKLMLDCVNLFAGNPKFWDKAYLPKPMVSLTLWSLLLVTFQDETKAKVMLELMMDSIPAVDYEVVKKNVLIMP